METKEANQIVCNYFAQLKKTGKISMCSTKKTVLLPLLLDMQSDLFINRTQKEQEYLKRFTQELYTNVVIEGGAQIPVDPDKECPCEDLISQYAFDSIFN